MYLAKVVKTSEMTADVFNHIYDNNIIVEDGFGYWSIGGYEGGQIVDDWLRSQGGADGETILIEHG